MYLKNIKYDILYCYKVNMLLNINYSFHTKIDGYTIMSNPSISQNHIKSYICQRKGGRMYALVYWAGQIREAMFIFTHVLAKRAKHTGLITFTTPLNICVDFLLQSGFSRTIQYPVYYILTYLPVLYPYGQLVFDFRQQINQLCHKRSVDYMQSQT